MKRRMKKRVFILGIILATLVLLTISAFYR